MDAVGRYRIASEAGDIESLIETLTERVLARLAEPPTFHVPRHSVSHTRHYFPDMAHRSGAASVDRTLDAFAVFERDAELAVQEHRGRAAAASEVQHPHTRTKW